MKLQIKRGQEKKKGIFSSGEVIFSLTCRVEFTPEEKTLIDYYKENKIEKLFNEMVVGYIMTRVVELSELDKKEFLEKFRDIDLDFQLHRLLKGVTIKSDRALYLIIIESGLKEACKAFIRELYIIANYGRGETEEETIEIEVE